MFTVPCMQHRSGKLTIKGLKVTIGKGKIIAWASTDITFVILDIQEYLKQLWL